MAVEQRPKFSAMIATAAYKKAISNAITDPKRAASFVAAVTSAVSSNPALQECDPASILSAALLGEGIGLSPSPQLGQYYLVPYEERKTGIKRAQFQVGYRGYVQLAMRSAAYERLNVVAIKEGEFISWNPLTEELQAEFVEDQDKREELQTVGYYASFKLLNGFTKSIYWTRSKMERHAEKYSKGYAAKKGYTFWEKDFDNMAFKTMLRQLIGHWGIMTVDLQSALTNDMEVEDADVSEVRTVEPVELQTVQEVQAIPENTGAVVVEITANPKKEPEPVKVRKEDQRKPAQDNKPKTISLADL